MPIYLRETFRRHRETFFDSITKSWHKDTDLVQSSDEESAFIEIDDSISHRSCSSGSQDESDCNNDLFNESLLDHEIWDNILDHEVDEGTAENPNIPFVDADTRQRPSSQTLINCLVILLAFFWTYFPISDNAMEFLLLSLKRFFQAASISSNWLAAFAFAFPGSLYLFRKQIGLDGDKFTKYVVCPSCCALYKFEDSFRAVGTRKVSKTCSFVRFPKHKQRRMRNPCGTTLLKEVTTKNGATRPYPHKIYCYQSIVQTLEQFVRRTGFVQQCELWRNRDIRTAYQVMCDVFEGRVWRDFQEVDGLSFLGSPRNYALMLNVDWLQPFDHTPYSVGVLYLVLMNLPRSERFKRQNIFLVGIIPGPSEPKLNINSFLAPLVDELISLWEVGITLRHPGSPVIAERFRAALLSVACDMPASKKVCGFTAHNSKRGCNKCRKEFVTGGIGEGTDYSGFDACRSRNIVDHRKHVEEILAQTTQELQNAKVSLYGARYSELLRLSYFDCIRFTIVDPMHNLFLGTAKRMMEIWLELGIITRTDLEAIQHKIDACNVPSNMGRIPFKIAKSFCGFTAEQWKTWVTVFSPFALLEYLPDNHYKCWLNFVAACKILSKPMIGISDVGTAHSHLIKFCREVERLYGTGCITPNMHMHTHLADCVLDYGPVYSFWLFSFERYNGILGSYSTNNKSIEVQVMRKFLRDQSLRDFEFPEEYAQHFKDVTDRLHQREGGIAQTHAIDCKLSVMILQLCTCRINVQNELWFSLAGYSFGSPHVIEHLDGDEHQYLTDVYKIFFPEISANDIPLMCDKFASIEFGGERYGSRFSRLDRFSHILARWAGNYDGDVNVESTEERPGIVESFIKQSITYHGNVYSFSFACVRWFQHHPERFHYGNSAVIPEIWCANLFESLGPASFLPVQRISRKFVAGYSKVGDENVLFVMPLEKRVLL